MEGEEWSMGSWGREKRGEEEYSSPLWGDGNFFLFRFTAA